MSNEHNICQSCGRPLPNAEYRWDSGDIWGGAFVGVLAALIAMGFGLNIWLALAIGMLAGILGTVAIANASRKQWNHERDGE